MATCKERLSVEHPERVSDKEFGGCVGCPDHYGYLDKPVRCPWNGIEYGWTESCIPCWDREIPEKSGLIIGDSEIEHPDTDEKIVDKFNEIGNPNPFSPNELRKILDSGTRREFESGAVRDIQEGKGRCDLLPLDVVAFLYAGYENLIEDDITCAWVLYHISRFQVEGKIEHLRDALQKAGIFMSDEDMLLEVSKHFEEGAKKYGEYNWQKGIPVHCYIDSAVRHYLKFLRGDTDEPHDRAFCWNILCAIWTCKHKPELNPYGKEKEE